MALTPVGKVLRKARIDRDMLLKELAEKLDVSAAFLSAIEAGRKPMPRSFIDDVSEALNLDSIEQKLLRDAADQSADTVRISLGRSATAFDRSLASVLARNFDTLDAAQKEAIHKILRREKS